MVNACISSLDLCIFYSLQLRCGVITEPMGDGLSLQVTPVLTHDRRALPEVTISEKDGRPACQPTGRRHLKKMDAVPGRLYPPGRDGRDYMTPGT